MGNMHMMMRITFTEIVISSSSCVNRLTQSRGASIATRNPVVVITVADIIASFSTRISRSWCCAP